MCLTRNGYFILIVPEFSWFLKFGKTCEQYSYRKVVTLEHVEDRQRDEGSIVEAAKGTSYSLAYSGPLHRCCSI